MTHDTPQLQSTITMKYIIENLEPKLPEWSQLEYAHVLTHVEPSRVYFTNMADHSPANLSAAHVLKESAFSMSELLANKQRVCLLDELAEEELSPEDAERFDWIICGGILGDEDTEDYVAQDRNKGSDELQKHGFPLRRIGKPQMTTDTAVISAKRILEDRKRYEELKFADNPTVKISAM
ncbi:hypothetical protein G7K_3527-t1 [Saitoella complicata NRRL Y-17804]|uniref:SAM-dependent MTase TRM10-type domain-containing protein n=1 Tax=Saitoella complicata (strain BCRC 22490 / CBS 7301 / JCM 7358 / NBRC 10748 / NRRL Y-17804) TaxID=698492 RepID=A0A0E9NI80_SAICN|nr:hypothetical protein G7K_3527-t1 [Saitoella complicata NRRL Y-17804]